MLFLEIQFPILFWTYEYELYVTYYSTPKYIVVKTYPLSSTIIEPATPATQQLVVGVLNMLIDW